MLTDLPWDVLYIIFTHHPTVYNVGVRLNWEFHDHLTELALPRISRWEILQGEIQRYILNLWRDPPIRIYLMHPNRPMYEEFLGGRNQLPGSPFEKMEQYQWTISMQNSRYSGTYPGYIALVMKILDLINADYHLDPCTYQQILARRHSCCRRDPEYAENRSSHYLRRLLDRSENLKVHQNLLIEMCYAAIRHHRRIYVYPELMAILDDVSSQSAPD
jgi:hypothetical protein